MSIIQLTSSFYDDTHAYNKNITLTVFFHINVPVIQLLKGLCLFKRTKKKGKNDNL